MGDLEFFISELRRWGRVTNLISRSDLDVVWTRHVLDSAQLVSLAPDAGRWADIGSGAGFPGLVIALLLKSRAMAEVFLIESDGRKAAFLRHVSRETKAPARIFPARAESVLPTLPKVDIVTSRATASLPKLIEWSMPQLRLGAQGLFLKGENLAAELTEAQRIPTVSLSVVPSVAHDSSAIVKVSA